MSAELKKQVCDAIDAMRSELANPSGYSGTPRRLVRYVAFWSTIWSTIETMIYAPQTNMLEDQWLGP